MFILDTDHLSFLERGGHPLGERILKKIKEANEECVATIVSYEEQCRGWLAALAKAKKLSEQVHAYRKLLIQLRNYCSMTVVEFNERAATEFQLLKSGKLRIPTMDLKIASIALSLDATLVTRNLADFIKIPRLKLEDWTKE